MRLHKMFYSNPLPKIANPHHMSTFSFLHPSPPFSSTKTLTPTPSRHRLLRPVNSLPSSSSSSSSPLSVLTNLLWGKSLPPQLLISTVRSVWHSAWLLMMSQLAPSDPTGSYSRPSSQFPGKPHLISRQNMTALHLYVGLPCPWAHRTLIVRALKGLEGVLPVSVAAPGIDGLWVFRDDNEASREMGSSYRGGVRVLVNGKDNANGCRTMKEVYKLREGGYDGRSTVPMLWNVKKKEVICNESYDIIQLLNSEFNEVAGNPELDLEPPELKERIQEWNRVIYPNVNNGVYRCGFAQTQEAYDASVNNLFDTLDMVEDHLGRSRYLCGDSMTLADVCLFTTLIRFDLVYNVMFKCTKKKLVEYPNLYGYMRDIYQIPKVAETCNLEAMMDGYYKFLFPLNPGNIRPVMPGGSEHEALFRPHNRDSLSSANRSVHTTSF